MPDLTQETLRLIKNATDIRKANTVTTSTGLVAYDLQAPAKNLYPVYTPIRNRVPRVGGGKGTATNWKQVSAIGNSGGYAANPFVAEGQRANAMSITTANKAATYRTIGLEASVTWEAESAANEFEDERAETGRRLLEQTMLMEEISLLGGNTSVALGTPTAPTLSVAGSTGTLPALTYSVIVVALTLEGWINATNGTALTLTQTKTITGQDGQTYTTYGGYSNKSSNTTQAVTLGQILSCTVPTITGAIGYAWYVGAAGSEKLERITTLNSTTFSAPLLGTGQLASALTAADYSSNTNAYDGFLATAFNNVGTSYTNIFATGTPGTGTTLTGDGAGNIVELLAMFKSMWDKWQVSPSVLFVNSQELTNIIAKTYSKSTQPLLQYITPATPGSPAMITGGASVTGLLNPYTADQSKKIVPLMLHPNMPPGTIVSWAEELPTQYKSHNTPRLCEVRTRRDYYQIDFPMIRRAYEIGVYSEQVFVPYFPAGIGVITNIANG
jgi:hypothetical protein